MWRPNSLRELEENGWFFIGIGIVVAVSSGIIWINVFGEAMELTALDILTNPMTAIGYIVIVMGSGTDQAGLQRLLVPEVWGASISGG